MSLRKKAKKSLKIILGVVIGIILLDYLVLNLTYAINQKQYEPAFAVQGNTDGYVPQGLAYSDKYNIVIQTSYSSKQEASKIFITDMATGNLIKSFKLIDIDGHLDASHVGGVATDNTTVWITSDYSVREYSLDYIVRSKSDYLQCSKKTTLKTRGDFCYYKDNTLYIGDFFLNPFYKVPNNNPLLYIYNTASNYNYDEPEHVIPLPKMVQGMAILPDNKIVFTTSFTNLIRSKLLVYEGPLDETFDKNKLYKSIKLPAMAEGVFSIGNDLYILFENCSDKYFYAFPKLNHVVKYKIK